MTECKVFYSWQSDLPNCTNRGFIEKALENAVRSIRSNNSIEVEPVIDRDTIGIPGSPDIVHTIFTKIEQAQAFVCDVSIINNEEKKSRLAPNPNVLIELGYAIKAIGVDRIIMVMNTAFGKPEHLPFDLRARRIVSYHMPEACQDRALGRRNLEKDLERGLSSIFLGIGKKNSTEAEKELSKEERELLFNARETGLLYLIPNLQGDYVQVGDVTFPYWENPEQRIKYLDALNSLKDKNLVKHEKNALYRLTSQGFEAIHRNLDSL